MANHSKSRWTPNNLHRHADYAPVKKEIPDEDSSRNTTVSGDGEIGALNGRDDC